MRLTARWADRKIPKPSTNLTASRKEHRLPLSRAARWESLTVAVLFLGYMGYYVCRSNFSIARPLLLEAFADKGLTKETIGTIASLGTLCYAIGKFATGVLADFLGGRRMFLVGMVGSIGCTLLFGVSASVPAFGFAWMLNRLVQSGGWASLVKIASHWLPFERYGRVMGILTLSYLFGDALARYYLGLLLEVGLDWRQLFLAAALTLAAIAIITALFLRSRPGEVGLPEPPVSPANLFGTEGAADRPESLVELLRPFLSSFSFWMVLLLSLSLTLIRESLNDWLPTFFRESARLSAGAAARASALFPAAGGVSALLSGFASDRWAGGRRGFIMVLNLFGLLACMGSLAYWTTQRDPGMIDSLAGASADLPLLLTLVGAIGLCMIGPYTFLSGAIALDMGGRRASSTAAGLADGVGYLGGILAGQLVGRVADTRGWGAVFWLLTTAAAVALAAAWFYLLAPQGGGHDQVNAI